MMERGVIYGCFIVVLTFSSLPLFIEYIKVQKNYEVVKRPHHRLVKRPHHRHHQNVASSHDINIADHHIRQRREKAILESNLDYQDEEDIFVGHTTTILPIKIKRKREKIFAFHKSNLSTKSSDTQCQIRITETLPAAVFSKKDLAENHLTMHQAWCNLFDLAKVKIEIVSYHWGLQKGSGLGQQVYDSLARAVTDRKVHLSIIHTANKTEDERYDTIDLLKLDPDLVSVRSIHMPSLIEGGGVLHSKLLVADRKHFYLGSANLSDRGLTKTKEMGIFVTNCPKLAENAGNLFEVYWHLGGTKHVPKKWPNTFSTKINLDSPLAVENSIDGQILNIYLGSSPKPFCPNGRSDDLSILVHAITSAEKFIYVAVSDYAPMNVFGKIRKPWLILDDLLREAASKRDVHIRLMLSERAYTYKHRKEHLQSLLEYNKHLRKILFEVKVFHASNIAHFKSAHNKYFVTDKLGYIGTSNWAKDYYTRTAGVGFAFESTENEDGHVPKHDLRTELVDVFNRDWNSPHCKKLK